MDRIKIMIRIKFRFSIRVALKPNLIPNTPYKSATLNSKCGINFLTEKVQKHAFFLWCFWNLGAFRFRVTFNVLIRINSDNSSPI